MPQRGRQYGKGEQYAVGKAEIQNGIGAEYAVVGHFVLAEVDKHGQRTRRVYEKGNRVQKLFAQQHRKARYIYAYIADKQGYARKHGVVYVVSVAHNHTVLAVVLYE